MRSHSGKKFAFSVILLAVAVPGAAFAQVTSAEVTVHEWGTFTTVAGKDGRAIEWLPLSGPTDLPCFVHHYQNNQLVKIGPGVQLLSYEQARTGLRGRVRMETPVLYFYATQQATVNVRVEFPRGIMTEWYPQAEVTQWGVTTQTLRDPNQRSVIEWPIVTITPNAQQIFPSDVTESHYYAARATDAAPIEVAGQLEKFLFYRGVADFDVPLSAEVLPSGAVRIRNLGAEPLPAVILFENRGGRIGYRVIGTLQRETTASAPQVEASFGDLRGELEQQLVAQGLYRKEAAAMVDTWRDSWFEEGTRVFYVVPTAAVERILPLRVSGARVSTTRVFVGRMDVVTAGMEDAVERVLTSDSDALPDRFGRLLEPITDRILERTASSELRRAIAASRQDAFRRYVTASGKCQ